MVPGRPASPYLRPGFYDEALARGRHRDIIGGRWDETGRIQIAALCDLGLRPTDRVLDIGCGPLRTGVRLLRYLAPGNYWGTDLSAALMQRGYEAELDDDARARLPVTQLVQDGDFAFPGVPLEFDVLICLAVFTHLPPTDTARALCRIAARFRGVRRFFFSVALAPDPGTGPHRQHDGVVTHAGRAPYHLTRSALADMAGAAGLRLTLCPHRLPRGQVLCAAQPD